MVVEHCQKLDISTHLANFPRLSARAICAKR